MTFLFTGIQDSQRRWDEAPAEMAAAQRIHDRIVREAIEGCGGHLFATDGDGCGAAFATAASAAEAAVEVPADAGPQDKMLAFTGRRP